MTEIDNRQMLPIGALLKQGEYRVERYIASGGFGNTYEVVHTRLNKHLAMKEFFMRGINQREGTRVSVSLDDNRPAFLQMREKFYKEAQRLASMQELHIVEVSDFFEENDTAYYTMRLINGESLSAMMKRMDSALSEDEVRRILPQVLQALDAVHQQGIYHLDLKPGNIMVDGNGHCFLIDFGASKQLSAKESQTLSTSTGLCYTPGFAPTEQVSGNVNRIGPWTDFYALGATIYNLLTNQAPPEVDDVRYDGEQAFRFPATVSQDMRQLVFWLMQPDYPKRPQTVGEIVERIEAPRQQLHQPVHQSPPLYEQGEDRSSVETVRRESVDTVQEDSCDTVRETSEDPMQKNADELDGCAKPLVYGVGVFVAVLAIIALVTIVGTKSCRDKDYKDENYWYEPAETLMVDLGDDGLLPADSAVGLGEIESQQDMESFWGTGEMIHHHLCGMMGDYEAERPIELDFDCRRLPNGSGTVSNIIYKNVELGGKIRMTGQLSDDVIYLYGKDGSLDFTMTFNIETMVGTSKDGEKDLYIYFYEPQ